MYKQAFFTQQLLFMLCGAPAEGHRHQAAALPREVYVHE